MKILQVITTAFLVLLFCNSCQKNNADNTPILTQIKPVVKDGRLNFASVEDMRQYYFDIENAMKEAEDKEAVLESFENQYDYVPLRTVRVTPNSLTLRNDDEYFTTEELLNELKYDFIGDPVLQSVLNTYYEVGVESDVMIFMNGDQTFTIPQSNIAAINDLRDLSKTETDIPVDFLREYPDVTYESPTKSYATGARATVPGPSTIVYAYDGDFAVENVNCEVYIRTFSARLFEIVHDDNGTPNTNTDDINEVNDYTADSFEFIFGDGNMEVVENENEAEVSHTYDDIGEYDIIIRINYTDRDGVARSMEHTETISIDIACTDEDFDVHEMIESDDGSRAITTKLWYCCNVFGTHVGGFTRSYRWNTQREKWSRERADIFVELWATLRDDDCNANWSDNDSDLDTNSKWVFERMHCYFQYANRYIGDGDIYSHHYGEFDDSDNTYLENDLILEPCQ